MAPGDDEARQAGKDRSDAAAEHSFLSRSIKGAQYEIRLQRLHACVPEKVMDCAGQQCVKAAHSG